jgi:hypothetical protein
MWTSSSVRRDGEEPLSPAERAELLALRKRIAEQDKDIAFLKKASAYFAAMQTNRPGSL